MTTPPAIIVDHANPVHDGFCRCRACKPPIPVGATILRIPNEEHLGRVRAARRAAGLWLPAGFPSVLGSLPAKPLQLRSDEAVAQFTSHQGGRYAR